MYIIHVPVLSDVNGNYKAKDIMQQIQKANKEIEFPDKSIENTCLADLRYKGKPCVRSTAEGTVWNTELAAYTERKLTLYFA